MDCSQKYVANNATYDTLQNICLGGIMLYILGLNLTTIGVSLYGGVICKCPVSKIMLSSHFGNFIGGSSFFLNAIYYSQNGTPQLGCNVGLEHYFFLYLGMMAAMITLIFNSYTIFNGIVNNAWLPSSQNATSKTFILIWLISAVLSGLLTLIGTLYPKFQFCKATIISSVAIVISMYFFIRILNFLSKSERNIATQNRQDSSLHVKRAKFIVKINIFSYIALLMAGTIFNVIGYIYYQQSVHLAMIWLIRVTYAVMFTLEAHIFLYKTPKARQLLRYITTRKNTFGAEFPALSNDVHTSVHFKKEEPTTSSNVDNSLQ